MRSARRLQKLADEIRRIVAYQPQEEPELHRLAA